MIPTEDFKYLNVGGDSICSTTRNISIDAFVALVISKLDYKNRVLKDGF